jgi:hypothetical protein
MPSQLDRPIIITGAGRSGTKLLRSLLACAPETAVFPREINYIWRHGNIDFPTDELTPEQAQPDVRTFIREQFVKLARNREGRRIVEKTCANTLRLDFVHTIFPEAIIIHLIRDGRAVTESARRRWQARPELRYLLEKLRWVPVRDILHYGLRYLRYQLGRLQGNNNGAQSSWGPRFTGLDRLVAEKELVEVCAIQWRACVQAAEASLRRLPQEQTLTLRYEDLVADPAGVARQVYQHVGLNFTDACANFARQKVHSGNLEKWRQRLSTEDLHLILPHIETELQRHDYSV